MYNKKALFLMLILGLSVAGAGCSKDGDNAPVENPGIVPVATGPEPEPLNFGTTTADVIQTTSTAVGGVKVSVEVTRNADGSAKGFVVNKNGKLLKEVKPKLGEVDATIFRQTKTYVYLAPQIEGLGGYILYEALPTRLIRVNLTSGEEKELRGNGVAQDITADDRLVLWIVAGQGSLSFAVLEAATGKKIATIPVDKQYAQVGNGHFSPDAKKIGFAEAFGIPDRDGGAVVVVDLATGKQTKLAENKSNRIPHVRGWKNATTLDYYFE